MKIMSRDELETILNGQKSNKPIYEEQFEKFNKGIANLKHLNLNETLEKSAMFNMLIDQCDGLIKISDSHLSQLDQIEAEEKQVSDFLRLCRSDVNIDQIVSVEEIHRAEDGEVYKTRILFNGGYDLDTTYTRAELREIISKIKSKQAQSSQLSRAVEFLEEIAKEERHNLKTTHINYMACNFCSHDETGHFEHCIKGKAQAFLKEVKGDETEE